MNPYLNYVLNLPIIKKINSQVNSKKHTEISETDRYTASLISVSLLNNLNNNIVLITPSVFQAQKVYDDLSSVTTDVVFYPKDDFISTELLTESFEFKLERINALKELFFSKTPKIFVTNLSTLLTKSIKKEDYQSKILTLSLNQTIKPTDVLSYLMQTGYQKVYTIEKQGDVALRGSILDIFPLNDTKAYRIDFFGDTIDEIKLLDTETQRSSKTDVKEIIVMPSYEVFFTEEEVVIAKTCIEDKLSTIKDSESIHKYNDDLERFNLNHFEYLQKYISLFNQNNYSFIDYIDNKIVCFLDYDSILKQNDFSQNEMYEYLSNFKEYFFSHPFINNLSSYKFDHVVEFNYDIGKRSDSISIVALEPPKYSNRFDLLSIDLKNTYKYETVLISLKEKSKEIIENFLKSNDIEYFNTKDKVVENSINIIEGDFVPFNIKKEVLSLTEECIFKYYKTRAARYASNIESKRIKALSELKVGDFVVHYDYGIGQFVEIKSMTLSSGTSDFIHVDYAGGDSVYIPVENLSVLSKYAGEDGYIPKLSRLNSKEWEKTKSSARKEAKDLAERLLNLYSSRENTEGFKYPKFEELENEFDSEFNYETTKDQLKAIEETKEDMESGKLMDRLICGDVGFGKTEVALRAAYKAVLSGKQVAYLVPTTILARQHYYTFKERMSKYGVEVVLLSRFVSPNQIKENLKKIKNGYADIIIGTHRLLSKDVMFKDLGLLIIDEEQRFGVEAKEKIKELKSNVDVLTLTATPIPRTLEMAITGIKNISLIETPPKGRYPIQTYVLERNDYVVKEAIEREMSKGGQVFYLFNRVETIENVALYVKRLVPDARIACIHGQLSKPTIESVLNDFINGDIDVLVSTTIIETGIDIPNVNTLIVHDADRYGLSQLYQIKGRVGRSDKISYAYLMYDKNKNLSEDATKRLNAIKEFTELGSGFKIAVRDLTTRGAGEILGARQSGFMNKVGVELYLKLLDEEVKKKKGEIVESNTKETRLPIPRHIDKEYISDDYVLIEFHEKIADISSLSALNDLKSEMVDRFGSLSIELEEYLYAKLMENLINKCNFERVEYTKLKQVMVISQENSKKVNPELLFKVALSISRNFNFEYKSDKIIISYINKSSKIEMYKNISLFLEQLLNDKIL